MTTEWGIRHTQGIAKYRSEKEAFDNLPWHIRSWQRGQRKNDEAARPVIVRREVTDWEDAW